MDNQCGSHRRIETQFTFGNGHRTASSQIRSSTNEVQLREARVPFTHLSFAQGKHWHFYGMPDFLAFSSSHLLNYESKCSCSCHSAESSTLIVKAPACSGTTRRSAIQSDTGSCDATFTFPGYSSAISACQPHCLVNEDGYKNEQHSEILQANDPHAQNYFGFDWCRVSSSPYDRITILPLQSLLLPGRKLIGVSHGTRSTTASKSPRQVAATSRESDQRWKLWRR